MQNEYYENNKVDLSDVMQVILKNNSEARESYVECMLAVWAHYGLILSPSQEKLIRSVPSPDTIRRMRNKLVKGIRSRTAKLKEEDKIEVPKGSMWFE